MESFYPAHERLPSAEMATLFWEVAVTAAASDARCGIGL